MNSFPTKKKRMKRKLEMNDVLSIAVPPVSNDDEKTDYKKSRNQPSERPMGAVGLEPTES